MYNCINCDREISNPSFCPDCNSEALPMQSFQDLERLRFEALIRDDRYSYRSWQLTSIARIERKPGFGAGGAIFSYELIVKDGAGKDSLYCPLFRSDVVRLMKEYGWVF